MEEDEEPGTPTVLGLEVRTRQRREERKEEEECWEGERSPVVSSPLAADGKALVFTVAHSERSCSFSAVQG